jgi:hypothetical protein
VRFKITMKRFFCISFCLFYFALSGYGKQKITRVIEELDYKDYGKAIFREVTNNIYKLSISDIIKTYKDSTLNFEYSSEEVQKRGSTSETVQFQDGTHKGKDTMVYLEFNYSDIPIWLEIEGDNKTIFPGANLPIAICYKDQGKRQVLFYINYSDLKKISHEEQDFLQQYLNSIPSNNPNTRWQIVNPENIQQFALKEFSWALSILKSACYVGINLYTSDSLNMILDSASINKKKTHFLDYGQNLDTNATMGIVLIEEFNRGSDTFVTFKETALGLCANIKMKGIQLFNVPLYYIRYQDAGLVALLKNNSSVGQSIAFLRYVCDYQLLNRSSDNPLNSN